MRLSVADSSARAIVGIAPRSCRRCGPICSRAVWRGHFAISSFHPACCRSARRSSGRSSRFPRTRAASFVSDAPSKTSCVDQAWRRAASLGAHHRVGAADFTNRSGCDNATPRAQCADCSQSFSNPSLNVGPAKVIGGFRSFRSAPHKKSGASFFFYFVEYFHPASMFLDQLEIHAFSVHHSSCRPCSTIDPP